MFDRLLRAFGGTTPESSFVECRRCGTRLGPSEGACGRCGSTDVAHYDL